MSAAQDVPIMPKINPGISKSELAKMTGMTPAWFTFSGRNCRVPPYTRRPRTCLADCVGMRRCPLVMAITATTTATNRTIIKISFSKPMSPVPAPSVNSDFLRTVWPPEVSNSRLWVADGMRPMIPAMMMSEIPLPIPYSSICSPSHIRNMVPTVTVNTAANPNQ
jgi:hypothetical protein